MSNEKKARKRGKKKQAFIGPMPNPALTPRTPKVISQRKNVTPMNPPRNVSAHKASSCSILDPFCNHAKGAKRPDGLGTMSLPYQSSYTTPIKLLAGGQARYLFVPGYGIYTSVDSTYSLGTFTMAAAWGNSGASATFLQANAAEIRIVSYGVRLISVLPATSSSGYVILGTVANPTVSSTSTEGRTQYPEHSIRPLTAGFESVWYSKPTGATAHSFKPSSGITSTMSDFDWSALSVEVSGGPQVAGTIALMAEIICNVEFTLAETQGGMTNLIPPSRPANPVALTVQQKVQSATPSIFDTTKVAASSFIEQKVAEALPSLLKMGWEALPFAF